MNNLIKLAIIITILSLVIYYLIHRLKILNSYKKKYNDILVLAAYKERYNNPGDCPKGYRIPTLKEFEVLYNENNFDWTVKFIKDDSIIYNEEETKGIYYIKIVDNIYRPSDR
jgi:hypothetical protein